MPIAHERQIDIPDSDDTSVVQPSDWNRDHVLTGFLALLDMLSATPDALPYITANGSPAMASLSTPGRSIIGLATYDLIREAVGAAPLFSPHFTDVPTAPTAPLGTNTTQIATMAAIKAAIDNLVNAAPGTLDTLAELATALGGDANFAATVTAALGNRLRFDAAQSLSNPQKAQALSNLGIILGTAAALNVGVAANQIVQLDAAAKLPAIDGSQLTNLPGQNIAPEGQCVLTKVGANIVLSPKRGNRLTVNGVNCTIPDAGVSLAPTGLTVSTNYFIYAVATAGVITSLEASATGHSTSTTAGNKGVEIKTGDDTRSLVGYVRIITGPAFADTVTQRFVASYFNQKPRNMNGAISSASTASNSLIEGSTLDRIEWVQFSEEAISLSISASVTNANGFTSICNWVDGAALGQAISTQSNSTSDRQGVTPTHADTFAEGYHFASIGIAASTGGPAAISGSAARVVGLLTR